MKWSFKNAIWIIGKFFFWLTLLMVFLFIVELIIFPRLTTIFEVRDFFSEGGGCYIGGDVIAEVKCEEKATIETRQLLIEKVLNVPAQYIFLPVLIPLATLDTIYLLRQPAAPPGRQEITSLNDVSLLVKLSPLWLLAMISLIYYVWKNSIVFLRKLRNSK